MSALIISKAQYTPPPVPIDLASICKKDNRKSDVILLPNTTSCINQKWFYEALGPFLELKEIARLSMVCRSMRDYKNAILSKIKKVILSNYYEMKYFLNNFQNFKEFSHLVIYDVTSPNMENYFPELFFKLGEKECNQINHLEIHEISQEICSSWLLPPITQALKSLRLSVFLCEPNINQLGNKSIPNSIESISLNGMSDLFGENIFTKTWIKQLRHLEINGLNIEIENFSQLNILDKLKILVIEDIPDDKACALQTIIENLPSTLQSLSLVKCEFHYDLCRQEGLIYPNVKELNLSGSDITCTSLIELCGIFPNLQTLNLLDIQLKTFGLDFVDNEKQNHKTLIRLLQQKNIQNITIGFKNPRDVKWKCYINILPLKILIHHAQSLQYLSYQSVKGLTRKKIRKLLTSNPKIKELTAPFFRGSKNLIYEFPRVQFFFTHFLKPSKKEKREEVYEINKNWHSKIRPPLKKIFPPIENIPPPNGFTRPVQVGGSFQNPRAEINRCIEENGLKFNIGKKKAESSLKKPHGSTKRIKFS